MMDGSSQEKEVALKEFVSGIRDLTSDCSHPASSEFETEIYSLCGKPVLTFRSARPLRFGVTYSGELNWFNRSLFLEIRPRKVDYLELGDDDFQADALPDLEMGLERIHQINHDLDFFLKDYTHRHNINYCSPFAYVPEKQLFLPGLRPKVLNSVPCNRKLGLSLVSGSKIEGLEELLFKSWELFESLEAAAEGPLLWFSRTITGKDSLLIKGHLFAAAGLERRDFLYHMIDVDYFQKSIKTFLYQKKEVLRSFLPEEHFSNFQDLNSEVYRVIRDYAESEGMHYFRPHYNGK